MNYVISDLHGCYDEFIQLLKQINFSNNDTMYILGDNIDRGPNSIEILRYIYEHDNIISLIGNHELYLIDYINGCVHEKYWKEDGGETTLNAIKELEKTDNILYKNIVDDLLKWSYCYVIGDYILTHAGYNGMKIARPTSLETLKLMQPDDFVYSRNEFFKKRGIDDYITIFGHTPTQLIRQEFHQAKSNDIWVDEKYNDKIGIDGALVFGGQLNCINLNTMDIIVI